MQAAPDAASGRLVQPVGSNDSAATLLNTNIGSGCGTQGLTVMEIIRVPATYHYLPSLVHFPSVF
jgi:hypothetical protein